MGKRNRVKPKKKKPRSNRRERPGRPTVLAYHGRKYQTEANIVWIHAAETGVYEAFVLTGRRMVDRDVRKAIEELVVSIRSGKPIVDDDSSESSYCSNEGQQNQIIASGHDLVIWSIQQHWRNRADTLSLPGRDTLVGILRTLLGSIEVWSSRDPNSRGYLTYIGEFLAKTGYTIKEVSPDTEVLPVAP